MACLGVSYLPLLRRGQNCFFVVLEEVKYKISVFGSEAKRKRAKYLYGSDSKIVGIKKFFIELFFNPKQKLYQITSYLVQKF